MSKVSELFAFFYVNTFSDNAFENDSMAGIPIRGIKCLIYVWTKEVSENMCETSSCVYHHLFFSVGWFSQAVSS